MDLKLDHFVLIIPSVIIDYKLLIDECCKYVLDVPMISNDVRRLTKFRLVIMELLTNAMKHHHLANSSLQIFKMNSKIIVRKVDNGKIFSFKDAKTSEIYIFPLNYLKSEKIIVVLLGINYMLSLMIKSNLKVQFLNNDDLATASILDIPENFGLKIISRCSDLFYYYYDEANNQNVFEVIFE